ncbi:hypothetical protein, partial [Amycolatopsis lurida]|uniref:hypothetical protein n=1 Tax=Amycolatopsis lurida TaxID=31959 RepID=UPI00364D1EF5
EVFTHVESRGITESVGNHPSLSDEAVLARWSELPPLSRVLYGKMRSVHEERLFRRRRRGEEVSGLSALAAAVHQVVAIDPS